MSEAVRRDDATRVQRVATGDDAGSPQLPDRVCSDN